jgi:hypothetical protein
MSVAKYLRQAANVKPFIQNVCYSKCLNSMFDCFDLDMTPNYYATQFADILLFDHVNDNILKSSVKHNFVTEETDFIQVVDNSHRTMENMLLGPSAIESLTHVFTSSELKEYYKDSLHYPFKKTTIIRHYVDTNVFYDKNKDRQLKTLSTEMINKTKSLQEDFNKYTTYIQEHSITNGLPLHAMACGCIPILVNTDDLYNPTILRSGDNCMVVDSAEEALDTAEMLNNNNKVVESMKGDIKDSFGLFNILEETKQKWEDLLQ